MLFIGFTRCSELDLMVQTTNGTVIEYYFSLEELFHDHGYNSEFSVIHLEGVEIILNDLSVMRFDDIQMN